ncbi:MAG: NADH-quinone oxidoreductase subunit N [Actinobacteria bacterium]|nr:NADH-quinone oxidoreductase subunit N [Actinomycetota bacterium]
MNPTIDYHALAPEIVLTVTVAVCLLVDLVARRSELVPRLASLGVLGAIVPVITLSVDGANRTMFGGTYEVDNYALVFKGLFLIVAYLTILVSFHYIGEGDYYRGEFYVLLLTSVLGMTVMASARDLVTIFVALETITIPTFALAAWRKHDTKSNEAGLKYFLIGVISTAVMLYGMSVVYGVSGANKLVGIREYLVDTNEPALFAVGVFLTLVGFAFKVSAVPFHFWAPDTYEGAPTPVTAFLSVASKAGGFVALITIVNIAFFPSKGSWQPVIFVLAAASMTLGNLAALRQTNIVRMLAYSSVAQGGFMLVPLAVAADVSSNSAWEGVVVYLLIYAGMNLGAFAAVIAVARRTGSAEISSYAGLGRTDPALAVMMTIFLFSLAGIPFLAGWFAKLVMFRAAFDSGTTGAVILGVVAAINAVIAFFYYAGVGRQMWFREPDPAVERTAVPTPLTLNAAMLIVTVGVLALGVYPQAIARLGELAFTPG